MRNFLAAFLFVSWHLCPFIHKEIKENSVKLPSEFDGGIVDYIVNTTDLPVNQFLPLLLSYSWENQKSFQIFIKVLFQFFWFLRHSIWLRKTRSTLRKSFRILKSMQFSPRNKLETSDSAVLQQQRPLKNQESDGKYFTWATLLPFIHVPLVDWQNGRGNHGVWS